MRYYAWQGLCLCPVETAPPQDARPVAAPFAPLYFLVRRAPGTNRGLWRLTDLAELTAPEGPNLLLPLADRDPTLRGFLDEHGAGVVNLAFPTALAVAKRLWTRPKTGLRLTVVGLGDVGGVLLTGLKLLSGDRVSEIGVYDANEALCRRYEIELNQILGRDAPEVVIRDRAALFDCDAFLFTASRGVPPLGTKGDVRLLQYEKNREMLKDYVNQAAAVGFDGLFCQISDPVDLLCRSVFTQADGALLPDQIRGYGLGVMQARAVYAAKARGVDPAHVTAFGPHGAGLVVADHPTAYHDALSRELTEAAVTANLRVRDLGFKPFIAPALSSACLSVLDTLAGKWNRSAVGLGGVWFGCENRLTRLGTQVRRQPLAPALYERIAAAYAALGEGEPPCAP